MKPNSRNILYAAALTLLISSSGMAGRYYDARTARWTSPDPKMGKYPSWSQYNFSLDNPMCNVDPNGEEVHAYTERLGVKLFLQNAAGMSRDLPAQLRMCLLVGGAAAWETFRPRHSFLRISTPGSDQTLELGGPRDGHKEGTPLLQDLQGEPAERPGQLEHSVERPSGIGPGDMSFERGILEIHSLMSRYITTRGLPTYGSLGPNSNGYIRFLVEAAGGRVFLPMNAVGTGASATADYRQIYERILKEENMKDSSAKSDAISTEKKQ